MVRASLPLADLNRVRSQIEGSYRFADVRAAKAEWNELSDDLVAAILDGAAAFARQELEPLNLSMDRNGCALRDGRVRTAPGHREAWQAFVAAGWPTLEAGQAFGGQELPAAIAFAAQEQFDRACPAFGMLAVALRAGMRVLIVFGGDELQADWLTDMASGEAGATICVSEAEAGSDLSRIRTRAEPAGDGSWQVTGEKCWISYGDHDLTQRIGHIVLAQSVQAGGTRAPSLFFVPTVTPGGAPNAVRALRIEEKLGLHGSPTCVLAFEGAHAILLGESGRGLRQLFVMIAKMRLAVGAMGLGIAGGASDVAHLYARERKQGGSPAPLPIAEHPDVRRQLIAMQMRVNLFRGLLFAAANCADLGDCGDQQALALGSWLMPIVKTLGGEIGFETASAAMQVLGGAGYTSDWPIEQALRDARVLTIFEGTTGIQALDLVHRRLLRDDASFRAFVDAARACADPRLDACLDQLEQRADWLRDNSEFAEHGATAFLDQAGHAALSWLAAEALSSPSSDPGQRWLSEQWLSTAAEEAECKSKRVRRIIPEGGV